MPQLGQPMITLTLLGSIGAVVAFALVLLLVCLFWIYGYIRRRSKRRY